MLFSYLQVLQHRVDVEDADEREETEPTKPTRLAEHIGYGEVSVAACEFGCIEP